MTRERSEYTIQNPCEVAGRGYWSGQAISVRFLPAPAQTGIVFVRTDLPDRPRIPALVDYRESMSLRTVLCNADGVAVAMVEHLMAALVGNGIDNCIVEVSAEEMPGLDGSAAEFANAIQGAGRLEQDAVVTPYVVDRVIRLGTAASWIEASPVSGDFLNVEYQLDYGDQPIPAQEFSFDLVDSQSFCRELAPARTFVTSDQAEQLRSQGIASHVTARDLLIFSANGVVDNTLHFENECARHKALDMVGDLALAGFPLIGRFVSNRGGHELNAEMARKLRSLRLRENPGYRMTA